MVRFARIGLASAMAVTFSSALVAGVVGNASAAPPSAPPPRGNAHAVCGAVPQGYARCHLWQLDRAQPNKRPQPTPTSTAMPAPSPTPTTAPTVTAATGACPYLQVSSIAGYQPCDLQTAYSLPSSSAGSASAVVAIVDAYDDPNALSDLNVYRSTFGLPSLNTGGPTFTKVDQNGGSNYPAGNTSWAEEISLDLDMVSAICPNCSILLVEAASNSLSNLGAAAAYAGSAPGVVAMSNSYGGSEFCSRFSCETQFDSDYNHPGVAVTVSTGDAGYGVQYPAASPYVTAVGGTTLTLNADRTRQSETAWSGAGSGCSAVEAQPSWQASVRNIVSVCGRRSVADVSAVADPNTGVATYDTYGQSGWLVFGGTSVASPIIASVYALAGNTATASSYNGTSNAEWIYAHDTASTLYDVVSGSNGSCGTLLCNATSGWDGPTGTGTPSGIGGF